MQLLSNEKECFSFDLSNDASGSIYLAIGNKRIEIRKLGYGDFEISKKEIGNVEIELDLENCFQEISKRLSGYFFDRKKDSEYEDINFIMISGKVRGDEILSIGFTDVVLYDFNGYSVNGHIVAYYETESSDHIGITISIDSDAHPWIVFCTENVEIPRKP
ncbi:MAG: hypothetical protein GX442_21750 [Candidatus Riflebacteria bacterium]|nr:hypothetical protein [Candidatus Riflebacteria bacterium]